MYNSIVYTEIELVNGGDLALVRRHCINEGELKRMNIKVLVDSNVLMLCINELILTQLQLQNVEKERPHYLMAI